MVDLMMASGWKCKLPPIPTILTSPSACPSDHLPIATKISLRQGMSGRVKEVFLSTPHSMNAEAVQVAAHLYKAQLPLSAAKLGGL